MVLSERVYIYPCVNAYTDYHLKPGDNLIHLFLYRPYFLNIFQNKKIFTGGTWNSSLQWCN